MAAGKASALGLITVAYGVCIAAAAAVLYGGLGLPQPWDSFAADAVATLVIFAFSRAYKNSSFYIERLHTPACSVGAATNKVLKLS